MAPEGEKVKMNTGEKIVYQRKKHSITQEDLADQVGVSRQTVSKWEGNLALPDTASIARLADIFDVSTDYLIRDEVDEKEHVSQKKSLSIAIGLFIGFLALILLGFVLSLVVAYATFKALNGVITFVTIWSVAIVGAIILLSVYKNRSDYNEKDRHFLMSGTIGTLFAGVFTLGMFIPLPICDSAYNTSPAPSIVSIDLYWSWAYVGGVIGLGLAFLILPFLLMKGRAKEGNKENGDFLILGCFLSSAFLLVQTAGVYETEALPTLHGTTTIISFLIGLALIILLAVRKAIPLRTTLISAILSLASGYSFYVYLASPITPGYKHTNQLYEAPAFVLLGVLSLYLLVEGIIALKKKKGFFFLLSFIILGGGTLVLTLFSLIPLPSSVGVLFLIGYLLLIVYALPGILMAIRYSKGLSEPAKLTAESH
jgi:transcriptional regulator with XRE-family HTH domain